MNFLKNKKVVGLLVVSVLVLIVGLSLASGALKFNITATRTPETEMEAENSAAETNETFSKLQTQKPVLADRATTFKDADSDLTFSIKLPLGWATAESENLDLVAGSLVAEKLDDGSTFYANLNAVVGSHPSDFLTFESYQNGWKDATLAQYPSMEAVSDYSAVFNNIDVYVLEVSNAHPSGLILRQIQYIFYVNESHALVVTVTAPLNSWASYDQALKESVESIELVSK